SFSHNQKQPIPGTLYVGRRARLMSPAANSDAERGPGTIWPVVTRKTRAPPRLITSPATRPRNVSPRQHIQSFMFSATLSEMISGHHRQPSEGTTANYRKCRRAVKQGGPDKLYS